MKIWELLDLRAHKWFLKRPPELWCCLISSVGYVSMYIAWNQFPASDEYGQWSGRSLTGSLLKCWDIWQNFLSSFIWFLSSSFWFSTLECTIRCCAISRYSVAHDDIIKWKHFPHFWPLVRRIHCSLVDSPYKGQWCRALIFSLIYTWTNSWENNRDAGNLRHHQAHYNITVMA